MVIDEFVLNAVNSRRLR